MAATSQQPAPLRPAVLDWPVARLAVELAPLLADIAIEAVAAIDSTNSELMRRARAGRMPPTLLLAEAQHAGRGRLGRVWQTGSGEAGSALAFSLALTLKPRDWSGLSLAVGLALAEALHPQVRLSWPDELWVGGAKLGGVLVETAGSATGGDAARTVVVGVGINVAPVMGDFDPPAAHVQALLPGTDAPTLLSRLAAPLARTLLDFERTGFAPFAERFAARDLLAGQRVRLSDGSDGTAHGVDAGGALLLRTAEGERRVTSGEVSVRPLLPGRSV